MTLHPGTGVSADAALRRLIDIVGALAALIILAPLMAAIALAVRLDTTGPVLYSQLRLGRGGQHFRLYKFRKFRARCDGGWALTVEDDPRFTRVGRVLARWKLDELPQLWNVLAGDMSLVGPRPETLDFADCYAGSYRKILDHRPGLFGPCQVRFRNESSLYPAGQDPSEFYRTVLFPAKARIDLRWLSQRSLLSDIGWIARGIVAVLADPVSKASGNDGGRFEGATELELVSTAGAKPALPGYDSVAASSIGKEPR